MAKITEIIGTQSFELIRERLGFILADELSNQAAMTYNEDLDATVYIERFVAVSHSECPVVNVSLAKGDFDNYTQINHHGSYMFNVDIYTAKPSTTNEDGDYLSTIANHKLAGVCKAIILNPIYYILDFAPGFIEHRSVIDLNIGKPDRTPETDSLVMSRFTVLVKCKEDLNVINNIVTLLGSETGVRIGLTDKGYAYGVVQYPAFFDNGENVVFDNNQNVFWD